MKDKWSKLSQFMDEVQLSREYKREYKEGYDAYPKLGVSQNPYPKGTLENAEWEYGWCDAEGYDGFTRSFYDV